LNIMKEHYKLLHHTQIRLYGTGVMDYLWFPQLPRLRHAAYKHPI